MLYNQPFGITDPNAPYINGNPNTGTMGSIPPALSIEHPQREIVKVIQWDWRVMRSANNSPDRSATEGAIRRHEFALAARSADLLRQRRDG